MDDSAITCDEIRDVNGEAKPNNEKIKAFPANFNEKNLTLKAQVSIFY